MSTTEQTSGTDWQPGDLAVATVRGEPNVRVMRTHDVGWWTGRTVDGWYAHEDDHATDLRRLYVLDLGGQDPRSIVSALREASLDDTADQIEAQLPPAVPEPTGLGAVVRAHAEHDSVCEWVRVGVSVPSPWRWREEHGPESGVVRSHRPRRAQRGVVRVSIQPTQPRPADPHLLELLDIAHDLGAALSATHHVTGVSVLGDRIFIQGQFSDRAALARRFNLHVRPVADGPDWMAVGVHRGTEVIVSDVRKAVALMSTQPILDPEHDEYDPALDPDYDPSPYHQWEATEPRGLSVTEAHERAWQQKQEARS